MGPYAHLFIHPLSEHTRTHVHTTRNWLDLSGYSLVIAYVVMRLFCVSASSLGAVGAFMAVILWVKLFEVARAYETTGRFVRMMLRIFIVVIPFLFVLAVVILGFSFAFHLLFRTAPDSPSNADYKTWNVIVKVYAMMVGDMQSGGWLPIHTHTCVIHTHIHTYTHTHIHTYTHTHIIHTYTHTYTTHEVGLT